MSSDSNSQMDTISPVSRTSNGPCGIGRFGVEGGIPIAEGRLAELFSILAAGVLRVRSSAAFLNQPVPSNSELDFSAQQSGNDDMSKVDASND